MREKHAPGGSKLKLSKNRQSKILTVSNFISAKTFLIKNLWYFYLQHRVTIQLNHIMITSKCLFSFTKCA